MYMPVYLNFIVYLIQMFDLIKWHNKYSLMPILIIFFIFRNYFVKKKVTDCKTYVSNLL